MALVESQEERRARYKRLAIAAAAAAARSPMAEVRTAYLLLAESWSNLAETDEPAVLENGSSTLAVSENLQAAQSTEAACGGTGPEKH